MIHRTITPLAIAAALGAGAPIAAAQCTLVNPLPSVPGSGITVTLELVAGGLDYPATPTKIVQPDDGSGRLLIAGLGGVITLVQPGGAQSLFFDTTSANTKINPEHYGMTSIVLHPGYADPQSPGFRRFYCVLTEKKESGVADFGFGVNHQDIVYEFQADAADPDVGDPATRREILRVDQPALDHNMMDLVFDHDELLYVTFGDGGNNPPGDPVNSMNAQDVTQVFGKILRIDPLGAVGTTSANGNYSIPDDNPFVGVTGIDEIFVFGVRSPYRLTFDRLTGQGYFGDVGQKSIEEINVLTLGGNYGWNLKEGSYIYDTDTQQLCVDTSPDPSLIDPFGEYDHQVGRSIVGGYVYSGADTPILGGKMVLADYNGTGSVATRRAKLFFMNMSTGEIRQIDVSPAGEPLPERIYTLGEDVSGEIYIGGAAADGTNSVVLRIAGATNPCPGDIDGDGDTDVFDFSIFASGFGTPSGAFHADGDLDHNGSVDVFDFSVIAGDFGCVQ